jgi:hypothetical protein
VLLWHNTSIDKQGYHRDLYEKLIEMLS